MTVEETAELFEHLPADERADLYALLDTHLQQKILPVLREHTRNDILKLAAFPGESTGAVTTSEYISVLPETRVAAALRTVRAAARSSETVYIVYVLDRQKHLLGTVSLRELLLADDNATMEDIMHRHPVSVRAAWPRIRSTEMIRRYDLLALPVLDEHNAMLGIITVDDAMDIEKEQDATQLARFGGTATNDDTDLDILQSPLGSMFKVRVFWLIFLTVFGVVTSSFVAAQEEMLSHVIVLAAFIAPIVDMGGNTGSQSATLVHTCHERRRSLAPVAGRMARRQKRNPRSLRSGTHRSRTERRTGVFLQAHRSGSHHDRGPEHVRLHGGGQSDRHSSAFFCPSHRHGSGNAVLAAHHLDHGSCRRIHLFRLCLSLSVRSSACGMN